MLEDLAAHAYQRIMDNGGITVDLQGHEPSSGYAYSPYPELERVYPANAVTADTVLQYLNDNQQALAMPGNHLGAWHDQQSGNVFLDVSQVGPPTPDTVSEAKKQNQLAVMDLSNFQEIPTGLQRSREITTKIANQAVLNANMGRSLQGLPGPVNVPGHGPLQFGAHADIQRVANEYNQMHGLGAHPIDYLKVNPQHAQAVAQEYERMPHAPHDPMVASAYDALAHEVRAQYDHAVNNGYNFEFYPDHDPYPNSPREAVLDLHHNKHMFVYPTDTGYGMSDDPQDHPMLADSGVRWGGRPVTHNDLFRAIHDFYGHAKEGVGFRADGEDNAYRQHAAMFSPLAQRALASETRGQNSWVNFGPHGEHNQTATHDTVYAPQKAGLMPKWTSDPDLHRGVTSSVWDWDVAEQQFNFPNKHVSDDPEGILRAVELGYRVKPHIPVIEPPEFDHERYGAVRPEWINEWIRRNGPYVQHRTMPSVKPLIEQHGLIPWDAPGMNSKYDDALEPRANHVYVSHPSRTSENNDRHTVYFDMRKLDPERIHADEDPWIDQVNGWEPHLSKPREFQDGTNGQYAGVQDNHGDYKSYGDWADHHRLNESHHVAHSLNYYGTLAIDGGIDPAAIVQPEEVRAWHDANGTMDPPRSGTPYPSIRPYKAVPYNHPVVPTVRPLVSADDRANLQAQQDYEGLGEHPMDTEFEPQYDMSQINEPELHWSKVTQNQSSLIYTREGRRLNMTNSNDGEWHVVSQGWVNNFLSPEFKPKTEPAPPLGQCYFHPGRPAIAAEGGAPMCHDCLDRYQKAMLATRPDMREAPAHMLSSWESAWIPPESHGVLGPQSPEEHALTMLPRTQIRECPGCHWHGRMSDMCPMCGFDLIRNEYDRQMISKAEHEVWSFPLG